MKRAMWTGGVAAICALCAAAAAQDKPKAPDSPKPAAKQDTPKPAAKADAAKAGAKTQTGDEDPGHAWEAAMAKAGAVGPQHELLKGMEGVWDSAGKFWMDPSAPPMETKGQSVQKSIFGGRFIQQDFSSEFMGQPMLGLGLTGYDNLKKKFVGMWCESTGTSIMVTYGTYDAGTKTFTYTGEYDDPMTGSLKKCRYTIKIVDPDKHVMEWFEPGPDGKEMKGFEIVYTRKKSA